MSLLFLDQPSVGLNGAPIPRKKIGQSTLPSSRPMPDKEQPEKREEPSGTTLTVEEWIELMNKYDRLTQYAKKRREKSDE